MSPLDDYLHSLEQSNDFNGTALIYRQGKIIHCKGYGFANFEHSISNSAQTIFNIASITKQFTAAAILLLEESGKLNLQDKLCSHLSGLPLLWNQVTIHQLLTHTSGIPDYVGHVNWETTGKVKHTPREIVNLVVKQPLDFEPGSDYKYCATGYVLLGLLIESTSETTFTDYLQRNIFKPLNLENTGVISTTEVLEGRSSGYEKVDDQLFRQDYFDIDFAFASGNLFSTVDDLLVWNKALYSYKLLQKNSVDKMLSPTQACPLYGCGLELTQSSGLSIVGHKGGIGSYSSLIQYHAEKDIHLALLCNVESSRMLPLEVIAAELIRILETSAI